MHFKHWCDGEKVNWKLRVFAHFQPFWVCFYKLIWIPFSNIWWYQTGVLLFCIWCLVCKVELDLLALRNGENVGQNQWMVSQSVFLTICWYGFPERFAMLPLGLCHLLIIWDGTWSRCEFVACLLGKVYVSLLPACWVKCMGNVLAVYKVINLCLQILHCWG